MVPVKLRDVLSIDFYWNSMMKKTTGYGWTNQPTNGRTDQRTDGPTNTPSHDAWKNLKTPKQVKAMVKV